MKTRNDRCRKAFSENTLVTCNRPEGHYGLHRDKVRKDHSSVSWGDNECVTREVPGFTVKVWYHTGAYEEIPNAPAETAASIYAEAEDSERVAAAEVFGPTGTLVDHCSHPGLTL